MAGKNLPGNKIPKTPPHTTGKPGRPKKTSYVCCSCGAEYTKQDGNFLVSSSELFAANNYYVPICKGCLEKYYQTTLLPALDYDDQRAIEVMCSLCDWYFHIDAFNMSKKAIDSQGCGVLCSIYSGRRRLKQVALKGNTYIDTILQRREAAMKITDLSEAAGDNPDPDANHKKVDPEIIHMFGLGYTPEEFEYLGEQYQDWTSRYECNTKALEECIKALCVAQLNIRRAQQNNDAKGASDAMKSFKDLLNAANLSPKQNQEDQLAQTETFGTLIRRWEDDRPIPEPDPEFKDVDGIGRLVRGIFTGHLARMFNIKNEWEDEYQDAIAPYTVTKPVYTQEDDDSDDDIEAVFGNAKHADDDNDE